MDNNEGDKKQIFTCTWTIENYIYSWLRTEESMVGPSFDVDKLHDTVWHLNLYSSGKSDGQSIGFYLERKDDREPQTIVIDFELSMLAPDGTTLVAKKSENVSFSKNAEQGFEHFVKKDEVFGLKKCDFLPHDTLTTRCTMWTRDGAFLDSGYCFARTHILVERRCLLWKIEKFSHLVPGVIKSMILNWDGNRSPILELQLYLTGGQLCEEMLNMEFVPPVAIWCLLDVKLFVLDVAGNKVECGEDQLWFEFVEEDEQQVSQKMMLTLSKQKLMANKDIYLRSDVLSIQVELAYPTKTFVEEITKIDAGTRHPLSRTSLDGRRYLLNREGTPSNSSSPLEDDLRALYVGGILSDTKLRTQMEIFPAHRNILSARSPVFKEIFTKESDESAMEFVDVNDLDADTVHRLLVYMYSDNLEELQWNGAIRLYAAAHKYAISDLKGKCSAFLETRLNISNACELLDVAATHQDADLKNFVQDFIVECGKDIFNSSKWRDFMEVNLPVAAETMHQKCTKN